MCRLNENRISALFKFVKSGLWLPVVLPFFLYQLIFSWHLRSAKRLKLQDKVVLITGASSGLGEALAHAFYNAGCKLILAARRTDELERVKGQLLASEPPVPTHHPVILNLDLNDLKSIPKTAADALGIYGSIDVLVNNSGISSRGDIRSTSLDVDLKIMVVNYFGHVALTKCILRAMVSRGGGHIVAISSIQGKVAIPFRSSYAASKFAMGAFFDCLRSEVSEENVRVTVVHPGYIQTNLSINAFKADGSPYGVMDANTASGISSEKAAERILAGVVRGENEIYIASFTNKIAIYLRLLCPSLFFYLMARKAKKNQ